VKELRKEQIQLKKKKEEDLQVCSYVYRCSNISTNVQKLNETIAHLKDQLQELKAKTGLEAKYVKKEAQVLCF